MIAAWNTRPAFDTLRFTRALVDTGVECRHAETHATAVSVAAT